MNTMKSTNTRDQRFYDLAYLLAANSECRYQFGSILVDGNRVLAMGVNVLKTHPIAKEYGKHCISIHAEMNTIIRSPYTSGTTLYIARYSESLDSKPCKTCMRLIIAANIKTIVYMKNNELTKDRL